MVSRGPARRTLLLASWVAALAVFLQLREPGFWREIVWPFERDRARGPETGEPEALRGNRATTVGTRESAPGASGVGAGDSGFAPAPGQATVGARGMAARVRPAEPRPAEARRVGPSLPALPFARRPAPGGAALWRRVAAAWRLNSEGRYAEAWEIARTLPVESRHPELVRVSALTALWAGQDGAAEHLLRSWLARDPSSAEARLSLAEVELRRGEQGAARALLDETAASGSLDVEQTALLASLQAWAGDGRGAIASYEAVLGARPDDVAVLAALARALEAEREDEEAMRVVARGLALAPDDPELLLLRARAAAALGDRMRAADDYERCLAARPTDVDLRLEVARFQVNAGEPRRSVALYHEVIELRGPQGLRVELARALLAAGEYAEAEGVAADALEAAEDGPEARLAHAQSVYLEGRPGEAADLFEDAASAGEERGLGAPWQARVALARDDHLAAWWLLGDSLDAYEAAQGAGAAPPGPNGTPSPAELWLARGSAAEKRGDYRRAREAYENAAGLGARLESGVALDRLAQKLRTALEAAYVHFSDANRIDLDGAVLNTDFWVNGSARVTVQAIAQVVEQRQARFTRTGGSVEVSDVFPLPELSLAGRVGFENSSAGGGNLVVGRLSARRYFADTSVLGVKGYRESLLSGHEDLDPRLFNRIIDLEAIGPSFAINGGRLMLDKALRETARDRFWVEIGAENYQDGNLRGLAYGHYQLPLRSAPGSWTVIRPNAFVEVFKRPDVPAYFSPRTHATIGIAGHTIFGSGPWRIEAELNPQVLVTEGDVGLGVYGLLDASVQLGRATVGLSGFAFYDSDDGYWLARAMARVVVPF